MIAEIRARTLEQFRPVERLPLSTWIQQNVWLPNELSATPGPVQLVKYQRELADAMGDPNIERVTILKGARLGYTLLQICSVAARIVQSPTSVIICVPTDDDVRSLVVGPLESIFNASPTLRGLLPEPRTGTTTRDTLKFRRGPNWSIRCLSARAPRNLRAHAAQVIIADEVDAFEVTVEGEAVALLEKRSLTYNPRKIILGSTPTDENSYISAAYERGDMRIFECKCQHCEAYHELLWRDVHWPEGRPLEAYWACPSCGGVHTDADKPLLVEQGRWRATAPHVTGHASFRINCLVANFGPSTAWGTLAAEFTAAARKPELLRVFVNTLLAQKWRDDADDGPAPHELQNALSRPISLEAIPESVLVLVSGVDVQGDRIEIATVGFDSDDCWHVLAHDVLLGDPLKEPVWADAYDLLSARYPHPLGSTIGRDAIAIDAGDGNTTDRVLQFVAGHRNLRMVALKGASGPRPPLTPTASKRSRGLMIAGVDPIKGRILDRLTKKTGIVASQDLDANWWQQLCSEHRTVKYSRGQPTVLYSRYPGLRSEALDCLVYALCARSVVAINPQRRLAELGSRVALAPPMPSVIRSAWLTGAR